MAIDANLARAFHKNRLTTSAKETLTIVLMANDHGMRRASLRTYRLMLTAMAQVDVSVTQPAMTLGRHRDRRMARHNQPDDFQIPVPGPPFSRNRQFIRTISAPTKKIMLA